GGVGRGDALDVAAAGSARATRTACPATAGAVVVRDGSGAVHADLAGAAARVRAFLARGARARAARASGAAAAIIGGDRAGGVHADLAGDAARVRALLARDGRARIARGARPFGVHRL